MRKVSIIFISVLFGLVVYIALLNLIPTAYTQEAVDTKKQPVVRVLPFKEGEKLTYELRYKKLKTGKSILTFNGEVKLDEKTVYHITFFTNSFVVKDTEELYAEKGTFLPLEVHRKVKRMGTTTNRIIEKYDQDNFKIDIKKKSKLFSRKFSIEKDSKIHNAILLTYYYRMKETFGKDEKFKITLPTVDFEVIFEGIETIEVPLGEYRAYSFSSNPPKFKFWLSADERRIPLKIENPGTLGYSMVLKAIEN